MNIGWSAEFERWVFLDFGFTTFLREIIGEKTYSKFIGTFRYTYDEIQKLYYLNEGDRVDFYYNDVYGLERSIALIEGRRKMKESSEESDEDCGGAFIDINFHCIETDDQKVSLYRTFF